MSSKSFILTIVDPILLKGYIERLKFFSTSYMSFLIVFRFFLCYFNASVN